MLGKFYVSALRVCPIVLDFASEDFPFFIFYMGRKFNWGKGREWALFLFFNETSICIGGH